MIIQLSKKYADMITMKFVQVEFLGETRIIIIIIIIIISAGTSLVSNSFHFKWNQNILNSGINAFWFQVKVEGMTDKMVPARIIIISIIVLIIRVSPKSSSFNNNNSNNNNNNNNNNFYIH